MKARWKCRSAGITNGDKRINSDAVPTASEFIDLYLDLEEMERTQLYLRGHTNAFAYLKEIDIL